MGNVSRKDAERWAPASDEYFEHYAQGLYDEAAYLQFILPVDQLRIEAARGDLIIGHAGVDGIYFCFRAGRDGVYAYYGIEDRHRLVAPDIGALIKGWYDGSITV